MTAFVGPWFLDTFAGATGLTRVHYVMLLPSERICVDRVRFRVGHGFTDVEATRHMYQQFADADIGERCVLTSSAPAAGLLQQGVADYEVVDELSSATVDTGKPLFR